MPKLSQIHEEDVLDPSQKINKAIGERVRMGLFYKIAEQQLQAQGVFGSGQESINTITTPVKQVKTLNSTAKVLKEVFGGDRSKRSAPGVSKSTGVPLQGVELIFNQYAGHAWTIKKNDGVSWAERNSSFKYHHAIEANTTTSTVPVADQTERAYASTTSVGGLEGFSIERLQNITKIIAGAKKTLSDSKQEITNCDIVDEDEEEVDEAEAPVNEVKV